MKSRIEYIIVFLCYFIALGIVGFLVNFPANASTESCGDEFEVKQTLAVELRQRIIWSGFNSDNGETVLLWVGYEQVRGGIHDGMYEWTMTINRPDNILCVIAWGWRPNQGLFEMAP